MYLVPDVCDGNILVVIANIFQIVFGYKEYIPVHA